MTKSAPQATKQHLSFQEGVEAACILFALNTEHTGILRLTITAGLPDIYLHGDGQQTLVREWTAFIHAAITSALMLNAPNNVLVAYLRQTKNLLQAQGVLHSEQTEAFIDGPFAVYMEHMAQERQKECPALLFQRLQEKNLPQITEKSCAILAGTMAMALAAILDKLEQYEIAVE